MSDPVLDRVLRTITRHALLAPGEQVVVGVSGGADSLVLLHVLIRLRERIAIRLHAATLDHGLRGTAGAEDAEFVRRTAETWGVPVTVGQADVAALATQRRLGIEEAARAARYTFLGETARQAGAAKVAVGHHQDDQAETVLLHLIRGSGLDGLRGMLPVTPLPGETSLVLVRPLLDVARTEIEAYAAAHDLWPRQDATNRDPAYTRNRIRHGVLPLLEQINPNIRATLARTAAILQGEADLGRLAGEAALARVRRDSPPGMVTIDRAAWGTLSLAEKRSVIRAAAGPRRVDLALVHVDQAVDVADSGRVGAESMLPGGLRLRVEYGVLTLAAAGSGILVDAPRLEEASPYFAPGERVQWVFGAWMFTAAPLTPEDDLAAIHVDPLAAALAIPAGARLHLRARRDGDRFVPRGMGGHSQKLSDTFINMRVPAEWRDFVPLLEADNVIAWFVVPGDKGVRGRVAELFAVQPPDAPEDRPGMTMTCVQWRRKD